MTTTLQCSTGVTTVGYKNASVLVAGQHGFLSEDTLDVLALCETNYYGAVNELVRRRCDVVFVLCLHIHGMFIGLFGGLFSSACRVR